MQGRQEKISSQGHCLFSHSVSHREIHGFDPILVFIFLRISDCCVLQKIIPFFFAGPLPPISFPSLFPHLSVKFLDFMCNVLPSLLLLLLPLPLVRLLLLDFADILAVLFATPDVARCQHGPPDCSGQRRTSTAGWAAPDLSRQKICHKMCQKYVKKECQKECQKICQKNVKKYVKRYVRGYVQRWKNVRRHVRRYVKRYVKKERQK